MDSKQFLMNIYEDFFEVQRPSNNINLETTNKEEFPQIEVKKEEREEEKQQRNTKMKEAFEQIDKLYITETSKDTLKKIIEYMRKYNEHIENEYIPFNMCIYGTNTETVKAILLTISNCTEEYNYVKKGDIIEVSLYNLEKPGQVEDMYNKENSIIFIKDFEGIEDKEQEFKNKFMHNLEEKISENPQTHMTILSAKSKETIDKAFEKNENIKEKIFNFEIQEQKPDIQDAYQEVLGKLKKNNEVTDEFSVKLLDYIAATYTNGLLSYPEYRDKLCKTILFNKGEKLTQDDIPEYEKEKSMDEIFAELNELVGLGKVKQVLQDLVSLIELKQKTNGTLKIKDTNLHMVFLGNPGTGKTTVARLVAQILYNLKYIKQNKLIEVSSKDLVAEYVGQTGPKTMAVVEKALGGVLFVDEAYSLASGQGQGNSFNEEAIATLIQAMENYRDNLVVIFAGYTKEMQSFLNANSGIVSRIGYTLEFEDYTEQELLQIFNSMMKKSGFNVTKEAQDKVVKIISEYKNTKNFGNARFVRNIYEKSIIKHASNTKGKKAKKILVTIEEKDISVENLLKM